MRRISCKPNREKTSIGILQLTRDGPKTKGEKQSGRRRFVGSLKKTGNILNLRQLRNARGRAQTPKEGRKRSDILRFVMKRKYD